MEKQHRAQWLLILMTAAQEISKPRLMGPLLCEHAPFQKQDMNETMFS